MTIASTVSEIEYAGDGVTTVFDIPFEFDTSADIKVVETTSGNPVVVTTGFSITGGGGSNGTLTRSTALPVGTNLKIIDNPELTQPVDYIDNDAFPAEVHEDALDRLTRICKRLSGRLDLTARVSDGDPASGASMTFPTVAARRGMLAAWANSAAAQLEPLLTLPAGTALSQSIIAALLYPQTAAESTAGVTPVNYQYPPGCVNRYATNTTPGTTDMGAAITAAIAATPQYPNGGGTVTFLGETYAYATSPNFGKANIAIVGQQGTVLKHTGTGSAFVFDAGAGSDFFNGMAVKNFIVQGNASSTHGMYLRGIGRSTFENIFVMSCANTGDALHLEFALLNSWINFKVNTAGGVSVPLNGIKLTRRGVGENTTTQTFTNPCIELVTTVGGFGIVLDYAQSNTFLGGTVEANRSGISITANGGGQNTFIETDMEGQVSGTDISIVGSLYNAFINSYCTGAVTFGASASLNTMLGGLLEGALTTNVASIGNSFRGVTINGTITDSSVSDFSACFTSAGVAITGKNATGTAMRRRTVTYSASMTIDAATGNHFDITATNGSAFTINAPTNPTDGQRIRIRLINSSGGALGAATWNAVFKMSAWTNPANGTSRAIDFDYNGSVWVQTSQTGVDVPN